MNTPPPRWRRIIAAAVLAATAVALPASAGAADDNRVALVEQLKSQAIEAVRDGKFDGANALFTKAAGLTDDPAIRRMAGWVRDFDAQRVRFSAERRAEYDKAVADVRLLLDKDYPAYATDAAARAHGLADDKKAFAAEPWVVKLIADSTALADAAKDRHEWMGAARLYSDLAAIEPLNLRWKNELKGATRRVRLWALYTPDLLKKYQEAQSDQRQAVARLLKPSTQPATKPADDEPTDEFRTDWHDTLRGVQADMLWDALHDAHDEYYRAVEYKALLLGGVRGLRAVADTEGLDQAFPALADETKKTAFLTELDAIVAEADAATPKTEQFVLRSALAKLKEINAATIALPEEVLVSEFADGAFAELDPFSSMIWPSDLAEFVKQTQGEFSGVGIQIQLDDDLNLKVVSPLEDSPAYQAGIKAGDIVTQIDGKRARGITLNEAVKRITGPEGTTVTLTIRDPQGDTKDHLIRRETIKVASIKGWEHRTGGGWNYYVDPAAKIAYIRITNFTKTTGDDFARVVDDLRADGARGIILDLRYNPGGLLVAATEVCDKLLGDGVIVSTRADRPTPNPPSVTTAKKSDDDCDLPMVVLVNQYSASASEIVSGALKDRDRATVVGERTFGKGSVQMLFPLSTRAALVKLTTSHYYLPSGRCLHREENSTVWGVDPDLTVEMTPEQMRAAIDARQEMDVLRDAATPTKGRAEALRDAAPEIGRSVAAATAGDPLGVDAQLSAALLMIRLQTTGL